MANIPSRTLALAVATGLAVGGLFVATSPAEAAITYTSLTSGRSSSSGAKVLPSPFTCDFVENPVAPPVDPGAPGNADDPPAFTENGGPVTRSFGFGGKATNSLDPTDVITASSSGSTTASVTGVGGHFRVFDVTHTATASVVPAKGAASGCHARHRIELESSGIITISQPGWLTLDITGSGTPVSTANPGYYSAYIYADRVRPTVIANTVNYNYEQEYSGVEVATSKGHGTNTVFVTPGTFEVYTDFELEADTSYDNPNPAPPSFAASSTRSATVHATGTFQPAGAKDGKAVSVAKGKRYVKLLERNCTTDKVTAKLNKKALKNATNVVFKVNGKKKRVVNLAKKFPKKGLVQVGPIADDQAATVEAIVTLKAKGAAKPTLRQAYLACS